MNTAEERQADILKSKLEAALKEGPKTGELSDEDLECISGGTTLTGEFFIARCPVCGWQAAFNNQHASDTRVVAADHIDRNKDCTNDKLDVYYFCQGQL